MLKAIVINEEETVGCVDEIIHYTNGIKLNQLSGIMSSLQKKELINTDGFQVTITEKGKEVLK